MSQTLYELELAHLHIEELTEANHRYAPVLPSRPSGIARALRHGLGRAMIRAGEALDGREPARGPQYTRPQPARRLP